VLLHDAGLKLEDRPRALAGRSVGEALLAVHRSYLKPLLPLVHEGLLTGMAHITGGGLYDNVPRVLPEGTAARMDRKAVPRSPICELIVELGKVAPEEAYRVLNMGVGMVLAVRAADADKLAGRLRGLGEQPFALGEVVAGDGTVELR
jgi:phosphoribosylformylglycinamidine cyclo-ligase